MNSEPLDFAHVFEGLFLRGLRGQLDAELMRRVKEKGVDLSKPLEPAYPAHVLVDCLTVAAQTLYPNQTLERGINTLGHVFFRSYVDTFMGRAMLSVLRMVGPRRTLERMQRNFRTGNNYIETRFVSVAPGHAELWFNETGAYRRIFRASSSRARR